MRKKVYLCVMKKSILLLAAFAVMFAAGCRKDPTAGEIAVEAISIASPELDADGYFCATVGQAYEVVADVLPLDATQPLVWSPDSLVYVVPSSEDPLNHTVTMGVLGDGLTSVTVSAGDVSATMKLSISEPPVELKKIIFDASDVTVTEGESVGIHYSLVPENAENMSDWKWSIHPSGVVSYEYEENDTYAVTADAPGTATVTLTAGGISASCKITVVSSYVPVSSISASDVSVNVYDRFSVPVTVMPSDATTKGVRFEVADPDILDYEGSIGSEGNFIALKTGTTTVTAASLDNKAGKSCQFKVTVSERPLPDKSVDLGIRDWDTGLPVLFRTCNLGSEATLDAGYLYAWGDPEPYYYSKSPYTWKDGKEEGYVLENYKWYDSVTKKYTRYVRADGGDGKKVLEAADDPASIALGGKWCVPRAQDLVDLWNRCSRTEEVRSGIHGMTFTSTVAGYEGNSIFLPCGGYLMGTENVADGSFESFYGDRYYMGCYQSSDMPEDGYFLAMVFYDGEIHYRAEPRHLGESIRPVWRGSY